MTSNIGNPIRRSTEDTFPEHIPRMLSSVAQKIGRRLIDRISRLEHDAHEHGRSGVL